MVPNLNVSGQSMTKEAKSMTQMSGIVSWPIISTKIKCIHNSIFVLKRHVERYTYCSEKNQTEGLHHEVRVRSSPVMSRVGPELD